MKKTCKKFVLGAASLAMIGGMSPIFTNNTYAYSDFPLDFSETFYTTVGPDYYTYIDLYDYDYASDVTVRIADTSIADRYYGEKELHPKTGGKKVKLDDSVTVKGRAPIGISKIVPCFFDNIICIQGKKVGETELIITDQGVTTRVPLKSVKLTPEANQIGALGDTFTGTATIEGADESLLSLDDYDSSSNVSISVRGNRGTEYTIRSRKDYSDMPYGGAYLRWKIGEQYVDGGTEFMFYPIEIVNNIDDSEETEEIAKNDTISLYISFMNYIHEAYPSAPPSGTIRLDNFELDNGAIVNIRVLADDLFGTGTFKTYLDANDSSISATAKEKLSAKLPEKASGVAYKNLSATTQYCRTIGEASAASFQVSGRGGNSDEYCADFAEFVQLSTPIEVTLDASDLPALKDGYTRKLYVAMENGNKVETIDGEYNAKTKTFTFKTNVFGNFAYGYVDEFVPVVPDTGMAPQKVAMVATATFAPLAVLTLGAFIARNKKKASNKLAKKHNHFE